jgi:hypothetical protein
MCILYRTLCIILSRDEVIIDGVWFDNRIYWTLKYTTHYYSL